MFDSTPNANSFGGNLGCRVLMSNAKKRPPSSELGNATKKKKVATKKKKVATKKKKVATKNQTAKKKTVPKKSST
jgi:uncharacterized protein with WD repeat